MATHPLSQGQLRLLHQAGGGVLFRPALKVLEALGRGGHDAVIIGGAVRDLVLGRRPDDLDLATSATPEQVLALAETGAWLPIPVGKAFGVVRVRLSGAEFEVATYRSEEGYADGRRPDLDGIEFQGSLEEDVLRRDFTMNGLALRFLDEDPVVVDLVGGTEDIRDRIIRTIGDPLERFQEDALRPLRAVRFAAVLGFVIEEDTVAAMSDKALGLRRVSGERIQQELSKTMGRGDAGLAVDLLSSAGFLPHLFPALDTDPCDVTLLRDLVHRMPRSPGLPLFLATLSVASDASRAPGDPAAERCEGLAAYLKLSRADTIAATMTVREADALLAAEPLSLPRRADLYRSPHYRRAMHLARAVASDQGLAALSVLDQERAALPAKRLDPPTLITGEDLKELGIQQGPAVGAMLRAVQDAQVTGEVTTRAAALSWVQGRTEGD